MQTAAFLYINVLWVLLTLFNRSLAVPGKQYTSNSATSLCAKLRACTLCSRICILAVYKLVSEISDGLWARVVYRGL